MEANSTFETTIGTAAVTTKRFTSDRPDRETKEAATGDEN
jgi:hypothetical protein